MAQSNHSAKVLARLYIQCYQFIKLTGVGQVRRGGGLLAGHPFPVPATGRRRIRNNYCYVFRSRAPQPRKASTSWPWTLGRAPCRPFWKLLHPTHTPKSQSCRISRKRTDLLFGGLCQQKLHRIGELNLINSSIFCTCIQLPVVITCLPDI